MEVHSGWTHNQLIREWHFKAALTSAQVCGRFQEQLRPLGSFLENVILGSLSSRSYDSIPTTHFVSHICLCYCHMIRKNTIIWHVVPILVSSYIYIRQSSCWQQWRLNGEQLGDDEWENIQMYLSLFVGGKSIPHHLGNSVLHGEARWGHRAIWG